MSRVSLDAFIMAEADTSCVLDEAVKLVEFTAVDAGGRMKRSDLDLGTWFNGVK